MTRRYPLRPPPRNLQFSRGSTAPRRPARGRAVHAGRSARRRPSGALPGPIALRTLERVWSKRAAVDYGLQRRATLAALFRGLATATDVCDADPYLLRAAKHHGEPTSRDCPVCRREPVIELSYTFGDALGEYSGRIKGPRELDAMQREHAEFTVYVVEVCRGCGWNHLIGSYVLGDGVPRERPRRRRATP